MITAFTLFLLDRVEVNSGPSISWFFWGVISVAFIQDLTLIYVGL